MQVEAVLGGGEAGLGEAFTWVGVGVGNAAVSPARQKAMLSIPLSPHPATWLHLPKHEHRTSSLDKRYRIYAGRRGVLPKFQKLDDGDRAGLRPNNLA